MFDKPIKMRNGLPFERPVIRPMYSNLWDEVFFHYLDWGKWVMPAKLQLESAGK